MCDTLRGLLQVATGTLLTLKVSNESNKIIELWTLYKFLLFCELIVHSYLLSSDTQRQDVGCTESRHAGHRPGILPCAERGRSKDNREMQNSLSLSQKKSIKWARKMNSQLLPKWISLCNEWTCKSPTQFNHKLYIVHVLSGSLP